VKNIALRILFTLLLLVSTVMVAAASDVLIDRPGNDFSNMDLASADPSLCETACAANMACAAWTYVNPGVQGPKARCWLKDHVPPSKDASCCTSGVRKTLAAPGVGIDLLGGDYTSFDLASANSSLCQTACAGDAVCAAWTYVNPGVQGPKARCWLKSVLVPARPSSCCVSGMKAYDGMDHGSDRPGGDIANSDLASNDPALCSAQCAANGSCQAWTYVKPGVQGPNARCWLKNSVPVAVASSCCASGVKSPNTWDTRYDYAKACAAENGIIPAFDCMDGEQLPITHNGVNQTSTAGGCDKPVILGLNGDGQCIPYARLLRISTGVANVETTAICRKYHGSTGAGDVNFDDVAMIQHNKATGKTCFFQSPVDVPSRQNGTVRPSPFSDTQASRTAWLETASRQGPGGITCTACHDGGPFILSPYVAQKADPSKWDPLGAYHPDPFGIFASAPVSHRVQPVGTACSGCHKIGLSAWHGVDQAIRFSMPPGNTLTGSAWDSTFAAAVNAINACVANPAGTGCNEQ
jgi:hypothetical protein